MYAAAPAPGMTPALLIKRTIATKIATMSNELRTFGRIPPAMRSERRTLLLLLPLLAVVAIEVCTSPKDFCSRVNRATDADDTLNYGYQRDIQDLQVGHPSCTTCPRLSIKDLCLNNQCFLGVTVGFAPVVGVGVAVDLLSKACSCCILCCSERR